MLCRLWLALCGWQEIHGIEISARWRENELAQLREKKD